MSQEKNTDFREERQASMAVGFSGGEHEQSGILPFQDQRPQAVVQRKLQEMANSSPQAGKADHFHRMANKNSISGSLEQKSPPSFQALQRKEQETENDHPTRQKAVPVSSDPPVIQRLLVQLGSDIAQDVNAQRLKESNPIEFREGTMDSLVQGEVLHLLAHSGGNEFADMKAYDLFSHLVQNGLNPANVSGIQLHGCESTDFASSLEFFLNKEDKGLGWAPQGKIKVKGIPGYSVISTTGRNFSIGKDKGNDDVWKQIRIPVNQNPSNKLLKGYNKEQFPGEIRKIKRLRSLPGVKGQLFMQVLQDLAQKVENVDLGRFGEANLISLGKMVDRVISIMQIPVTPLGDISQDHVGKMQNDIRKKLREINPAPPAPAEEEGDLDLDFATQDWGGGGQEDAGDDGIPLDFEFDLANLGTPPPVPQGGGISADTADPDEAFSFDTGGGDDFDFDSLIADMNAQLKELNEMQGSGTN